MREALAQCVLYTLPEDLQFTVQGQQPGQPPVRLFFAPEVADRLAAAIRDLNAQGIIPQINSAFRSIADQAAMRRLRPTFAAAGPSWHEAGGAVDMQVSRAQRATMIATMASYGFRNGTNFSPSEPWHFDGRGFLGSRTEAINRAQTAWAIGNIRQLR